MMPVMRRRDSCWSLLVLAAGCAGVSVDPETANAANLPTQQLSADDRRELSGAVDRAMQSVVLRRFDLARAAATEALAIDPRSARARAILGMVHLQEAAASDPHDLVVANEGELQMKLAQQLAPEDPFVGWMAAVFLAEAGHTSAAAEAAEQALARATGAPPAERAALLGIAGTYRYELGEERAALPHLEAYVDLRPDDATAQFRLGSSLLRIAAVPQGPRPNAFLLAQRQAERAAKAFARCVELSPGDEDAALAIATAHWRAADLARERAGAAATSEESQHRTAAAAQLRAIAARFPASPEPWFRLGVLAESRSAPAEARTAYAEALHRSPRHLPTLLNLAALLDRIGEADAATSLSRQVLDIDAVQPGLSDQERKRLRARVGAPASQDQAPRML